ncbi:hypothetical protein CDAR_206121 [Caerostris darwini]|uniref:Uncharacterized protein n=1 Tax=Caerostris darwini TaxID=1538125 RepID=A0AAV4VBB1_9ARAC|nr:hypothetical protein CDAR_206121 [Caerostris darwini]
MAHLSTFSKGILRKLLDLPLNPKLLNEDNAETASIAVECFDEQNTEGFHPELQSCKGIEEVNSQTMKEWYCSHTPEEIHSVRL